MSVAGARNRDSFGSVSNPYRVLAADTGLITLVPAPRRSTIFVQKIHIQITTPSVGELWTFQDGKGIPIVPAVSAGAVAHFDFNFGPDGVPCSAASAFVLNITGATGAVGWITWEAFHKLVPVDDYASLILALQPLAYWRFEESNGTVFFDTSGNFHHAFGGANGASVANQIGVRYQKASALRDGTFGIEGTLPTVDGLGIFPVTLTVSPSTVAPTGTITVTWAGIPALAQNAFNWVALTKVGRRPEQYSGWKYIANSGSGSMVMALNEQVGGTPEPGLYDLFLYYANSWNQMQRILGQVAISPNGPTGLSVSSPSPVPLTLGPSCTFECAFTLHTNPPNYGFVCGDNNGGLYLYGNGGVYNVNLNYSGANHLSAPIALETPYYLAVVCNAGAVTFLLNGQPWGTAAAWPGMTIINLLNQFPSGPLPLIADIDELVLYGFALNSDIIAAHAARWS